MSGRPALMFLILIASNTAQSLAQPLETRHVDVFRVKGRFGGWPANHGIWIWGDEILVGFSAGYYKDRGPYHHIHKQKPEEHLLARSLNGGETWDIENPSDNGALIPVGEALHGIQPPGLRERPWQDCPGGIDFTHPNFCLTARMTSVRRGPSRFYYSLDRGHNWEGPFRLPMFGQRGIAARTDYLINGPSDLMLFVTASKPNGQEGRPLCLRTTDGGRTWKIASWIGREPSGFAIMPSTVRISDQHLFTAVRRRDGPKRWIETFRSRDNAQTWEHVGIAAPDLGAGNPPSMIRLADGRPCLTYGVRREPFEIRARLSSDDGATWGSELVLRGSGGGPDIGYTRTVRTTSGRIVTVYYWHDEAQSDRYIAATLWTPPNKP